MAIVLKFLQPDGETLELPILSRCTVGRSSACDFVIKDNKISGKHGCFEVSRKGQLLYTDLGSSNGSFLNNNLVTTTYIRLHDELRLGSTTISICQDKLSKSEVLTLGTNSNPNQDITMNDKSTTVKKVFGLNKTPPPKKKK